MLTQKLPNAAATLITVTTTATLLSELIATAASESVSLAGLDGIDLRPDGDIRFLADGNTPTATEGLLLNTFTSLRGVDLTKMMLISPSGNVSVELQVGKSQEGEADTKEPAGGGGSWDGGTVANPSTFQSTVNFESTATFESQSVFQSDMTWNMSETDEFGTKQNNGYINHEKMEFGVTEQDEFATIVGQSGYEFGAGSVSEEHENGTLTYQFSRSATATERKVVGVTATGVEDVIYNENQAGNVDNDIIYQAIYKSNAQIDSGGGYEPVETVFGQFWARIKQAFDTPVIAYFFKDYNGENYLEMDEESFKVLKPRYTSTSQDTLITNLPNPWADTIELLLDTDTQIDTILNGGSNLMGQVVTYVIPAGVTITNKAGNISNNYELHLDGNDDILTTGTTVLNLKFMGTYWMQTSPIVVLD